MKKSPPSNHSTSSEVVMLAIDDIAIANPRARNDRAHKAIVRSIEQIGLKRPITVRRRPQPKRPTLRAGLRSGAHGSLPTSRASANRGLRHRCG